MTGPPAAGDGEGPDAAAARLTGRPVTGRKRRSGALTEVTLADGEVVMVKRGDGPGAVRAEAAGLRWPADTGTVRIPAVYGHDREWPVTGRVQAGRPNASASGCPTWPAPPNRPARLHGDLWNGNVLWGADGHVWLIDPAAHGGHRETDLAMLHLFGCPHLDDVLAGYQERAPLADRWAERVGVHQLFPLLVHAVLFGRGHAEQALAGARAALGR